jgi:DNA-binding winged helix-turn-helix (wHTH) protein
MADPIQLGPWSFSPQLGLLERAGETKRLESRAAEVLNVLCQRRGALVTHQELVDLVWAGRELSRNSVAVVIGDLRRALEDDARAPRFIETIPKRGYRLLARDIVPNAEMTPPHFARWSAPSKILALCASLLAVLGVGVLTQQSVMARPLASVSVSAFANETARAEYDSLSISVTQLINTNLARRRGVEVLASGASDADIRMRGTLAMWEGAPAVYLFAEDPRDGSVIWSGIAPGPEPALPRQIDEQIGEFVDGLQREEASADR